MSRRQKPRTVEHFPRMKQRGGRRRHRQRQSQILADMPGILADQFRAMGVAVTRFLDAVRDAFAAFRPRIIQPAQTRADYVLAAETDQQ